MANPLLDERFIDRTVVMGEPLTMNGVVQKTTLLFAILFVSAVFVFMKGLQGYVDMMLPLAMGAAFTGLVLAFLIAFTKKMFLTPLYAVAQGVFLGGISFVFEKFLPGVVQTAVLGTVMALASMLFLYSTRIIKCTEKFRSVVIVATLSIFGIYFVQFIASFFEMSIPGLFGAGTVGIGFSLLVIGIAAFNLILDFHTIEQSASYPTPKEYEWYYACTLMATLIWIYVEIANLVIKLNGRD